MSSEEEPTDAELETSEFQEIVQQELDRLPPAYQSVLTLFFIQELSYDEIVKVTGLPLGTVKTRLFRGRLILRAEVLKAFQDRQSIASIHTEGAVRKEIPS